MPHPFPRHPSRTYKDLRLRPALPQNQCITGDIGGAGGTMGTGIVAAHIIGRTITHTRLATTATVPGSGSILAGIVAIGVIGATVIGTGERVASQVLYGEP